MLQRKQYDNVGCIILSGGYSQRMRSPKALLMFSEGANFLQHISEVYHDAGINKIVAVINYEIELQDRGTFPAIDKIVKNYHPDKGRLYSLQLGLNELTNIEHCFVQNIDSPFVDKKIIESLIDQRNNADNITPAYKGKGGHPILISSAVANAIVAERNYEKNLKEFLSTYSRVKVEMENDKCLININTPEEYLNYFKNGY